MKTTRLILLPLLSLLCISALSSCANSGKDRPPTSEAVRKARLSNMQVIDSPGEDLIRSGAALPSQGMGGGQVKPPGAND